MKILHSYQTISKICEYLTKHKLKSEHTCSITQQLNEKNTHTHAKPKKIKEYDDFNKFRRKIYIFISNKT